MYNNVTVIVLIDVMANLPPETYYTGQKVQVYFKSDTTTIGIDGFRSSAQYPTTIFWYGGKAADLKDATGIRITDERGGIVLDAEMCRNFEQERDERDGVSFQVLTTR